MMKLLSKQGRLVKLADTPDLGSGAERRRGSTPRAATNFTIEDLALLGLSSFSPAIAGESF